MCQSKKDPHSKCKGNCGFCGKNYNNIKREPIIDIRSKEFEIMCFVKDTKVQYGSCTLEQTSIKFGDEFVKNCIYEKRILFIDKRNGGLDWSDSGKQYMGIQYIS